LSDWGLLGQETIAKAYNNSVTPYCQGPRPGAGARSLGIAGAKKEWPIPRYYVRRKTDDEVFAEYATQAIVIVATLGLVIVGSIVVRVFQEIARVFAEHGHKGQPKAAQLRRASMSLLEG